MLNELLTLSEGYLERQASYRSRSGLNRNRCIVRSTVTSTNPILNSNGYPRWVSVDPKPHLSRVTVGIALRRHCRALELDGSADTSMCSAYPNPNGHWKLLYPHIQTRRFRLERASYVPLVSVHGRVNPRLVHWAQLPTKVLAKRL
jgi:hypothetical protein